MAEIQTILSKSINYTGLISVKGLYQCIVKDLENKDYGATEQSHSEQVFEDGRQILIFLIGDRDVSEFATIKWEVNINFGKCQEVVVEKDGHDATMFKGSVEIKTEVFLETKMDKTFEQNAFMYFIKTVIDKYVFKSYLNRAKGQAKQDYATFEETVKSFLNFEKLR